VYLADWTPEGDNLLFMAFRSGGGFDIWSLGKGGTKSILNSDFSEMYPALSPDGKWLAYSSNESGRHEVYIRPFPSLEGVEQISTDGGVAPVWAADGAEIFYRAGSANPPEQAILRYMAVKVRLQDGRVYPSAPVELFKGRYGKGLPRRAYDVGPDGRFVFQRRPDEELARVREEFHPTRIHIIQNWTQELKEKFAEQN
jgi:serine/threonine-protein kinase